MFFGFIVVILTILNFESCILFLSRYTNIQPFAQSWSMKSHFNHPSLFLLYLKHPSLFLLLFIHFIFLIYASLSILPSISYFKLDLFLWQSLTWLTLSTLSIHNLWPFNFTKPYLNVFAYSGWFWVYDFSWVSVIQFFKLDLSNSRIFLDNVVITITFFFQVGTLCQSLW